MMERRTLHTLWEAVPTLSDQLCWRQTAGPNARKTKTVLEESVRLERGKEGLTQGR